MDEKTREQNGDIVATYRETDTERVLTVQSPDGSATVAQNREGYAMLAVRDESGEERERYYGFDVALDHVAELVGVTTHDIPVPAVAADMGM